MGTKFPFGMMKTFCRWVVMIVTHNMNEFYDTKPLKMVKMVNFMLCVS